ncbi:hypothetical protein, partial [Streptomyces sp. NPDC048659]|uniref:hypothetical protein n=1 Tax=Streptomyces sp. NPDC048659 TaxID=3155489 RepID=UPI003418AD93
MPVRAPTLPGTARRVVRWCGNFTAVGGRKLRTTAPRGRRTAPGVRLNARMFNVAGAAPTLAGATTTAAFNLGNTGGP